MAVKIEDVPGLGKPLAKFIEVLSKGVGRISKSYFERKDNEVKADEIRLMSDARAGAIKTLAAAVKEVSNDVDVIYTEEQGIKIKTKSAGPNAIEDNLSLNLRANQKELYQSTKKQINVESVTSIAAEQLAQETEVSDEPVDDDWISRFFNIVEDVSNKQMQKLWGKILAEEIKRPNNFSLRTLELIRNLSKREADTIMKVGSFAITTKNVSFLFTGSGWIGFLQKEFDIKHWETQLLIEIGILQPTSLQAYNIRNIDRESTASFLFGKKVLILKREPNSAEINIPAYIFTVPGTEIIKLLEIEPPKSYIRSFAEMLIPRKSLEIADFVQFDGDDLLVQNLEEYKLD